MKQKIASWFAPYRCMDWAVLYLRLFIGGVLLFHNVGKIQQYNEIFDTYPSIFFLGPQAVLVATTVVEVVLSVLIMMGLWVRMAALLMALGILGVFAWGGFGAGVEEFMWLGIYVFLIIAGGGSYGFDRMVCTSEGEK